MSLIDIREYYEDASGELKPGKKGLPVFPCLFYAWRIILTVFFSGISLQKEQWKTLKGLIPQIDDALEKL